MPLSAHSNHTPAGGVDAWRMCATHRTLHMLMPRDLSWEKSRATAVDGVTGPEVGAPERDGQSVGRFQVAVA